MHRVLSVKLSDLNNYLKCPLCKGYLIDSYTINECLHSFCKSCIIKYIKRKECCPVCKLSVMKERMNVFLKRDVNLQCIVYKLVPGLFKNEMKKRRQFYSNHPKALKFLKKKNMFDKETIGELDEAVLASDYQTEISLSIEYSDTGLSEIFESARNKELDPNAPKTYLLCPSSLTVNILKKFISNRFDQKPTGDIEIMYDDKPLNEDLTLLDVAYIYAWRRTAPMRLFYRYTSKTPETMNCDSSQVLASIDNKIETKPVVEAIKTPLENIKSPVKSVPHPTEIDIKKEVLTENDENSGEKEASKISQHVEEEEAQDLSAKTSLISTSTTTANNMNGDGLTITAMVASIAQDNRKAALVANRPVPIKPLPPPPPVPPPPDAGSTASDKENESTAHKTSSPSIPNKKLLNDNTSMLNNDSNGSSTVEPGVKPMVVDSASASSLNGKAKKPKLIKPKTADSGENEAVGRKKTAAKNQIGNAAKKPRLTKQPSQSPLNPEPTTIKSEAVEKPGYNNPLMPNNFQMLPGMQFMNHLISNKQSQRPEQSYSGWKSPFDYSGGNGDYKPMPALQNAFLNPKYTSTLFDYFQSKAQQTYQNQSFFGLGHQNHHQYPTTAAAAAAAMAAHYQHGFNPAPTPSPSQFMTYDDSFKKPTPSTTPASSSPFINPLASFIQDYQSSFFNSQMFNGINNNSSCNRSFGEKNGSVNDSSSSSVASGLDSLKETQLKISESCSLVNEAT